MIVRIASVLSAEEVAAIRARLEGGAWADGRITAGYQSAQVKDNLQLPHNDPVDREASDAVLRAVERRPPTPSFRRCSIVMVRACPSATMSTMPCGSFRARRIDCVPTFPRRSF